MDNKLLNDYNNIEYELLNTQSECIKASLLYGCIYDSYIKDQSLIESDNFLPALFYFIMTITRKDVQIYNNKFEKRLNMKLSTITDTLNKIKTYFDTKKVDINRISNIMWNTDFDKL